MQYQLVSLRGDRMSSSTTEGAVLIIGAGPTGMTAALELSRLGVAVRIVDRMAQPATTSRAIGVQARTLELFEQRGLVGAMLAKGNRGVAGSIYGEGKRLFRLEFAHNGSEYGYMLVVSQAETEGILRTALDRQGVKIEREVTFIALAQSEHDDLVTAVLKHRDGTLEEVRAAYVIDSEGAHSISRSTLGLHFAGSTRHEDYVLGDLYVDGELPDSDFHIFSSRFGFMGLFPMGNRHFRLIASNPLSEPRKDTAPSLDEIQKIYDQRSDIPARFRDMSWSSWFRINSRMVERLRVGRVFLGGDAAHIHSPAGAQGMNTGIQDMINLCWKLAFVIHGKADAKLLDTYNDERIPVIRDVLSQTEGLTNTIGSENTLFRSVFSYIAPWIVGTDFVQAGSTERMSQLSLNYRESALSSSRHHGGSLRAGDRVPNLPVVVIGGHGGVPSEPATQRLFELLSTDGFTLLFANLRDASKAHHDVETLPALWKGLMQVRSIAAQSGNEERFRELFGSDPACILVRPDGYSALHTSADDLDLLIKYFSAWLPVSAEKETKTL
jgi:2-polyprenyl-6-methoxyphenol hydroxylase-like FAD-dependent oxidoreductase